LILSLAWQDNSRPVVPAERRLFNN
jgi:hypothetical protein